MAKKSEVEKVGSVEGRVLPNNFEAEQAVLGCALIDGEATLSVVSKLEDIDFYIVSDGFDYFIERILKNYNISDIKIFSNVLKIKDGKFQTFFPNYDQSCTPRSGVCKCNVIKTNRIVTKRVLYAGDGMSDFCASKNADFLFAKGRLLEYCKNTKIDNMIEFNSFKEIKDYIKLL